MRCRLFEPARRQFLLESGSCFEGTKCGFRRRMTRHWGLVELRLISRRIHHYCIKINTNTGTVQELVYEFRIDELEAGEASQLTAEATRSSRIAMIVVQPSDDSHHITWIAMRKAVEVVPEEKMRNDDENNKTLNVKCMCQRRPDRGVQERGDVESEA